MSANKNHAMDKNHENVQDDESMALCREGHQGRAHLESLLPGSLGGEAEVDPVPGVVNHQHQHPRP